MKNRKPDTSAAWKAEAEQAQNEVKKVKHEIEQIMKELSIAKDALSQQIIAGKLCSLCFPTPKRSSICKESFVEKIKREIKQAWYQESNEALA